MPATDAIPDCLRPEVCPNCAYSLAGLPEPILCPECGRSINPSEIILYGWARGRHENLANSRGSRLVWVFLLPLTWAAFQIPNMVFNHQSRHFILPLIAVVVILNLLTLLRRQNIQHPGLIQVRLSKSGIVQYDAVNEPHLFGELLQIYGWVATLLLLAALIFAHLRHWIDPINFWILAYSLTLASFVFFRRARRVSRALASIDARAIADRNAAFTTETPWKLISDFTLASRQDNTRRLTVRRGGFWTFNPYPIDAEIRCTTEQADALREEIESHIALAQNADAK